MNKILNNLYRRNEILFSITLIVVFMLLGNIAYFLDTIFPLKGMGNFIINILFFIVIVRFIHSNNLSYSLKLRRPNVKAKYFLFYIPLIFYMFSPLLYGIIHPRLSFDLITFIINMIIIAIIEEIMYRGFLFTSLLPHGEATALTVSSIAFSFTNILSLFNASLSNLLTNLLSLAFSIAVGFMFAILFYKGNSILPCIIAHIFFNISMVICNDYSSTFVMRLIITISQIVVVTCYTFILWKTLPNAKTYSPYSVVHSEEE